MIEDRKNRRIRISGSGIFSGKVRCGDCGGTFGAKVWHSNDKYRRVILQCNNKFKNEKKCSTPHFNENELKELFVKSVDKIFSQKDQIREDFKLIRDNLPNSAEYEYEFEDFLNKLFKGEKLLTEFDEELFNTIIERITVYAKNDVRFVFINGTEVRV